MKKNRWVAVALAVLLGCESIYAAQQPKDMNALTFSRLNDNVIEWDEIESLVTTFSPTYTAARTQAKEAVERAYASAGAGREAQIEMGQVLSDYDADSRSSVNQAVASLEQMISSVSDPSMKEQLMEQLAGLKATQEGMKALEKGYESIGRALKKTDETIDRQLISAKNGLTYKSEAMILAYEQIRLNVETVKKQVSMYEEMQKAQSGAKEAGAATANDLLSVQVSLEGAKNGLVQLEEAMQQLRRSIGLDLGWSADALPEIGELPDPDANYLNGRSFEEDVKTACSNNTSILEKRHETIQSTTTAREVRDRAIAQMEENLRSCMQGLWSDIEEKTALYQASELTVERAKQSSEAAERKYKVGLVSRAQYEGLMLESIAQQASAQQAKLALFQAIHTYEWARKGIAPESIQ